MTTGKVGYRVLTGLVAVAACAPPVVEARTPPEDDQLPKVRSKRFAIHYEVAADTELTSVELWFTQDEGETWHNYGTDADRSSPFDFIAPTEGIYGYYLVLSSAEGSSSVPPTSGTAPQTWAFVDYTPPLLQLHFARFENDDPARGRLNIRWTAFDRYPEKRPISITFRREGEDTWLPLAGPMPNVGRYDWTVPAQLSGKILIKLAMCDRAGNLVERTSAPLELPTLDPKPTNATATQPAAPPIPPPAFRGAGSSDPAMEPAIDAAGSRRIQELYDQGTYHLLRGEYPLASARFREVLEVNPKHAKARYELAGIEMLHKNYDKAISGYKAVANDFPDQRQALYGLAMAYWSKKQYAQAREPLERILETNADDAAARLKLGDVYWQLGDAVRARQNWAETQQCKNAESGILEKANSRLQSFTIGATNP